MITETEIEELRKKIKADKFEQAYIKEKYFKIKYFDMPTIILDVDDFCDNFVEIEEQILCDMFKNEPKWKIVLIVGWEN